MNNAVVFIGIVAGLALNVWLLMVHFKQRRQGRLPGQRWDKDLKRWIDA